MKTVPVSIELDDILRERLDQCATVNPHIKISKKLFDDYMSGKEISVEEEKQINDHLRSKFLKIFLDAKETLIIPDDAAHKIIIEDIPKILDDLQIRFAYQDFYAYQFVDKLQDIVRRARRIQGVFTKKNVSEPVKMICREAYLAYIQGYHTSSIALCRSVVEAVLKDKYKISPSTKWTLGVIIEKPHIKKDLQEKKIFDDTKEIKCRGNEFLHQIAGGIIPSETSNMKILTLTQKVIKILLD